MYNLKYELVPIIQLVEIENTHIVRNAGEIFKLRFSSIFVGFDVFMLLFRCSVLIDI